MSLISLKIVGEEEEKAIRRGGSMYADNTYTLRTRTIILKVDCGYRKRWSTLTIAWHVITQIFLFERCYTGKKLILILNLEL